MVIEVILQLLPMLQVIWQWLQDYLEREEHRQRVFNEETNHLRERRRQLLLRYHRQRRRPLNKSCWIQPELRNPARYWEDKVPQLTDERFQKKFRLSRRSFNELVEVLRPCLERQDTYMRNAITVAKRVAIALYMLKSNSDLWTVADLFGVGKSTVGNVLHEVCRAINDNLYDTVVVFPTTPQQRQHIADGFLSRWQFPGVIGALDGSHIPIAAPSYCHEDYINYKNYHSIVLMALVNHDYQFIYTNIGKPGRANDASIFAESGLKEYCNSGVITNENKHIIGDGAFPLLGWLLVPFIQSLAMPLSQKYYNYRMSRARMVVENAFGRLKGRWRILLKRSDMSLPNMIQIVKTCVVLHNICEQNTERYYPHWDNLVQDADRLYPQPHMNVNQRDVSAYAKMKRNQLAENLVNDGVYFEDE